MRMNRVILAYSQLRGQLPAAVRARWRARLSPAHALRLSIDPRAQSRTLLGVALASGGSVGVDIEPLVNRAALPGWQGAFDAAERTAARSPRRALAIWTAKEAALKAAGATLAELAQVRVRGRRVEFRGQRWYCRAPRITPDTVTRLVTAQPVTRLLRQSVPASVALTP